MVIIIKIINIKTSNNFHSSSNVILFQQFCKLDCIFNFLQWIYSADYKDDIFSFYTRNDDVNAPLRKLSTSTGGLTTIVLSIPNILNIALRLYSELVRTVEFFIRFS